MVKEFNGIQIDITEEDYFKRDEKTREFMQWKMLEGLTKRFEALPCDVVRDKVSSLDNELKSLKRKSGIFGGIGAGIGFSIVVTVKGAWHYFFGN